MRKGINHKGHKVARRGPPSGADFLRGPWWPSWLGSYSQRHKPQRTQSCMKGTSLRCGFPSWPLVAFVVRLLLHSQRHKPQRTQSCTKGTSLRCGFPSWPLVAFVVRLLLHSQRHKPQRTQSCTKGTSLRCGFPSWPSVAFVVRLLLHSQRHKPQRTQSCTKRTSLRCGFPSWPLVTFLVRLLLHSQQFHVEDQRRIGRDRARKAALAVGQLRRDAQLPLAPDFHSGHAFVPTLDHFAGSQSERERLTGVDGAVELLAAGQPAGVVNLNLLALLRDRPRAYFNVPVFESRRRLGRSPCDFCRRLGIRTRCRGSLLRGTALRGGGCGRQRENCNEKPI